MNEIKTYHLKINLEYTAYVIIDNVAQKKVSKKTVYKKVYTSDIDSSKRAFKWEYMKKGYTVKSISIERVE